MISKKDLILKLRSDYSTKIRPLFIKDACESCGCEDNLELHHTKMFVEQFNETLDDLNINDKNFYDDNEIELIRTHMMGKQIKYKNITLCDRCHIKYHKENGRINIFKYDKTEQCSAYNVLDDKYIYIPPKICRMVMSKKISELELLIYIIMADLKENVSMSDILNYSVIDDSQHLSISKASLCGILKNLVASGFLIKTKIWRNCYYSFIEKKTRSMIKIPRNSLYYIFKYKLKPATYKCYILLLSIVNKKGDGKVINLNQKDLAKCIKLTQPHVSEMVNELDKVDLINIVRVYEEGSKRLLYNGYEILHI